MATKYVEGSANSPLEVKKQLPEAIKCPYCGTENKSSAKCKRCYAALEKVNKEEKING